MAKIVRYNGDLKAFASAAPGTERTIFGSVAQANDLTSQINASFLRGWGIVGPSDQPSLEDFNGAMYTHGQLLAYLHQAGIAEFNPAQEYHLGSVVQVSGVIWVSQSNNNTGNTPAPVSPFWAVPVARGSLLRTSVYRLSGATLQVSIDGGAFSTASSAFVAIAAAKLAEVEAVGGGGAGGGSASTAVGAFTSGGQGGSAGSQAKALLSIAVLNGATITVGAGGVGVVGATGNNGGSTTIGSILSCPGGIGGTTVVNTPIGTGFYSPPNGVSTASTGGNIYSGSGNPGDNFFAFVQDTFVSGAGASTVYGAGGAAKQTSDAPAKSGIAGNNGTGYGSGGSGAGSKSSNPTAFKGGDGFAGLVIIKEYA